MHVEKSGAKNKGLLSQKGLQNLQKNVNCVMGMFQAKKDMPNFYLSGTSRQ